MTQRFFIIRSLPIVLASVLILSTCNTPKDEDSMKVNIDILKRGVPIEKYIYGQFIEHLGKCIYGGIWAEMIEDRKFYYPVTWDFDPFGSDDDPYWNTGPYPYLKASPWQVIGREETVTMDKSNPFTGEHTPIISLPKGSGKKGVRQGGLGFIKGKSYQGRIILAGDESVLPVNIHLLSRTGESIELRINEISMDYISYPVTFTSSFDCDSTTIEIFSEGHGRFSIGTVSLMPSDNIKGWRKDVVDLMKELNSPVYRWPGGNFVSGYNWKDGIGDRDRRPPRKNPAWKGVEHNDVGIHEYMDLMEILDTEPFIAVNTGLGTVEEVSEEIEYCNGSPETPMGKLRAENGQKEPYKVKWWAVGNEMYGEWQLGHMPLSEYVKKNNAMAEAIWEKDPEAKLIAVGAVGEWSETMLSESSEHMNLLSEHIYVQELDNVQEHALQLRESIRRVADAHRKYRKELESLSDKNIRIALDEWNYWYGDYIYGELGVRYHHKDALGVAIGLHEFFRNSDIYFMANYAQTVNVIGCIKTTATTSGFAATGLPLKLYRNHFGTIPVFIDEVYDDLDIVASLNPNMNKITVSIINIASANKAINLDFGTTRIRPDGRLWSIHNSDPEAYNVPGEEPNIKIVEDHINLSDPNLSIPGYSIFIVEAEID
jgi:alpha-N-arabinofuranosidase